MLSRASGSSFFTVFSHASKSFSNPASCSACRTNNLWIWIYHYEWTAGRCTLQLQRNSVPTVPMDSCIWIDKRRWEFFGVSRQSDWRFRSRNPQSGSISARFQAQTDRSPTKCLTILSQQIINSSLNLNCKQIFPRIVWLKKGKKFNTRSQTGLIGLLLCPWCQVVDQNIFYHLGIADQQWLDVSRWPAKRLKPWVKTADANSKIQMI